MSKSTQNIIFTYQDNVICTGAKWYSSVNKMYANILNSCGFNVITKNFGNRGRLSISNIDHLHKAIKESNINDIYVFNSLDFYSLSKLGKKIYQLLNKIKYIVVWQEILKEDLTIIGNNRITNSTKKFIYHFFNRSKLNIISNLTSINSLQKHNIKHNKYFTVTGYSIINNLVPFTNNQTKNIDVLIYGTIHGSYKYRNNLIFNLQNINNSKYNIVVRDNIYDNILDSILQRTKIVVHIPSHEKLSHMPWPKITYLQSRKIFFIVEDNDDLHENKLENTVVYYKQNDVNDLHEKIGYFLENSELREEIISKNYKYITDNSNMDIIIPNLIKQII